MLIELLGRELPFLDIPILKGEMKVAMGPAIYQKLCD